MRPVFEGARIFWDVSNNVLHLSGSGPMEFEYDHEKDRLDIPWYYEDFAFVEFEGDITSIGTECFHTSDLECIDIPDSVTSIGPLAFCDCRSLKRVRIGRNVAEVSECAFSDCVNLTSLEFGERLERIGYEAFQSCAFDTLYVPDTVKDIGEHAFHGNRKLTRASIPGDLERLGGNPFSGCPSLEEISVRPGDGEYTSEDGMLFTRNGTVLIAYAGKKDGFADIGSPVVAVAREAFRGSSVREIHLGESVAIVDNGAFQDCVGLIRFSADTPSGGKMLTEIGANAFCGCSGLREAVLRKDCVMTCACAFMGCTNLQDISLPSKMKTIGVRAFENCGLRELELPERLETIEEGAFCGCTGIRKLASNENLAVIGEAAFLGCLGLEEIDLGDSVLEIGDGAFFLCPSLAVAYLHFDYGDESGFIPAGTQVVHVED